MAGRVLLLGLALVAVMLLQAVSLALPSSFGSLEMVDASGGLAPDLLGVSVNASGLSVRVALPDFWSVVASGGSVDGSNVTVFVGLLLDLDYNYSTGVEGPAKGDYWIVGIEAGLAVEYSVEVVSGGVTDKARGTLVVFGGRGPVPVGTVDMSYTVDSETGAVLVDVNWTDLYRLYNDATGSSLAEGPFRAVLMAHKPGPDDIDILSFSWVQSRLVDTASCGLAEFTIPEATVELRGNTSDWPAGSIACADTVESENGFVGWADFVSYRLAADSLYLYGGVEYAGSYAGDADYNVTRVVLRVYTPDMSNSVDIILDIVSFSWASEYSASYLIYANGAYFSEGVLGPGDIVVSNGLIEFRIPLDAVPTTVLGPGKQVLVDTVT